MTANSARKTVIIAKESTWGSAVTPTNKDVGLVQDINDNITREVIESMGLGSVQTQAVNTGMVDAGGSFTGEFQHSRVFEYILGTVTHTNSSSDYRHNFAVQDEAPSFTLMSGENNTADSGLIFTGCLVENAELSLALNEVLKLKVDYRGKDVTSTSTVPEPIIDSLPLFPHPLCDVQFDSVSADEIQNITFKFKKKVEKPGGAGSNVPQQGHATELKFEVSGQLGFSNSNFDKLFISGTTTGTTISTNSNPETTSIALIADNGVAYGSGQRHFEITLSNCQFSNWDKAASVGGLVFVDFTAMGTFSSCYGIDDITATNGGGNFS